jgi:uncharacterized phage-like protein YoqJ
VVLVLRKHLNPSKTNCRGESKTMINTTICFTGHRKINGVYPDNNNQHKWMNLFIYLITVIERAHSHGYRTFISGGALGVDQIAAWAVVNRMANPVYKNLILKIAKPFPSFYSKWPKETIETFHKLLDYATEVIDVSDGPYASWKMHHRNKWMVDNSAAVIAIWDGRKSGGTWNCISYALEKHKHVLVINPETREEKWITNKQEVN